MGALNDNMKNQYIYFKKRFIVAERAHLPVYELKYETFKALFWLCHFNDEDDIV